MLKRDKLDRIRCERMKTKTRFPRYDETKGQYVLQTWQTDMWVDYFVIKSQADLDAACRQVSCSAGMRVAHKFMRTTVIAQ